MEHGATEITLSEQWRENILRKDVIKFGGSVGVQ